MNCEVDASSEQWSGALGAYQEVDPPPLPSHPPNRRNAPVSAFTYIYASPAPRHIQHGEYYLGMYDTILP